MFILCFPAEVQVVEAVYYDINVPMTRDMMEAALMCLTAWTSAEQGFCMALNVTTDQQCETATTSNSAINYTSDLEIDPHGSFGIWDWNQNG